MIQTILRKQSYENSGKSGSKFQNIINLHCKCSKLLKISHLLNTLFVSNINKTIKKFLILKRHKHFLNHI